MNLDDIALMKSIDPDNVLDQIRSFPDQIKTDWDEGAADGTVYLPETGCLLIGSTGSPSCETRLMRESLKTISDLPVFILDDFTLPEWTGEQKVLLVLLGESGDEKGLLSQFLRGLELDYEMFVLARGGKLIELAKNNAVPYKIWENSIPVEICSAWKIFYILGRFSSSGTHLFKSVDIEKMVGSLKKMRELIDVDVPVVKNPAKRLAGQFFDRYVTLFASGSMFPVAEYWKARINTYAKAWAQVENLPQACYSTAAGIYQPENLLTQMMTFFLQSNSDNLSDRKLADEMRRLFMVEGFNTDVFIAEGATRIESIWNAVYFGEYVSYYLAMAYGVNPADFSGVEEMKGILSRE